MGEAPGDPRRNWRRSWQGNEICRPLLWLAVRRLDAEVSVSLSVREQRTEVADEVVEPDNEVIDLEEPLSLSRIRDKTLGDDIGNGARVLDAMQMVAQLFGHRLSLAAEFRGQIDELKGGLGRRLRIADMTRAGTYRRDAEGAVLRPSGDFDALQSREHEMGRAVVVGDAGADETDRRDWENGIRTEVGVDPGPGVAHTEETVVLQRITQHRAVTGFEDEQGHVTAGEEGGSSQHHHRRRFRQILNP